MRLINCVAAAGLALFLAASPAEAANTTLTNLTESQTFPALQSTIKWQVPTGGKPRYFTNYARATSSVRYDKATNSYVVRDTGSTLITSSFGPTNSPTVSGAFTTYSKNSGAETFRRYNPGSTTQGVTLTYTDYAQWRRTTTTSTGKSVNDTYFVWGIKTASADMPRTGSATYTTALDGTFVNGNGVYALTGTGSLTANFSGIGSITYNATLAGAREGDSAALSASPISLGGGAGTISFGGSAFNSTTPATGSGYAMGVSGYFYGPSAAEIGGLFRLTGNGGNGQGAMVGTRP